MPGKPLPDAEQLLQALIETMRPDVGPQTGLSGIHTGGVWLAERLHAALGLQTALGLLDVSFYRGDYEKIGMLPRRKAYDIRSSRRPPALSSRRALSRTHHT